VVHIYIGKQKVVWILKLRKNGWEAAASALRFHLILTNLVPISQNLVSMSQNLKLMSKKTGGGGYYNFIFS
jgi:hypothetical protein